jgi:hypothetical protein
MVGMASSLATNGPKTAAQPDETAERDAIVIHAMHDRDANLGLATMCIGVGQGITVILERV